MSASRPAIPSRIILHREGFPAEPGLDIAVSAVLHEWVARGDHEAAVRIHATPRMVAFGRRDRHAPGYADAVHASREAGFLPIERLAGGRAAVFHEQTLGVSLVTSVADAAIGVSERFVHAAETTVRALRDLGVDARIGEVPGEYCPGAYSVNARSEQKLAGFGQRLIRGAAHVGGVVVVDDVASINTVLVPVYEALGLPFLPATTGAVAAERPGAALQEVTDALVSVLASQTTVETQALPIALVGEARARVASFVSRPSG